MRGVLLVNMPFAALDTPSLALGLFKSRLRAENIPCRVVDLNLRFAEMAGWDAYDLILKLPAIMAGEQLFAREVFGDRLPSDAEYYREVLETGLAARDIPPRLEEIRRHVPAFLRHCLESIPWHAYDVIGFTSLFEQNLPSLALARLIKQRWPEKIIVFGGANCEDIMGLTLHRSFPFVDYVFTGEADRAFPELILRLKYGHPVEGIPGMVHRRGRQSVQAAPAQPIDDLDALPIPDYDDYFAHLAGSRLRQWVQPSLLMEGARGCWWGAKSHCTFCGLNGSTLRFRSKRAERALSELEYLVDRHGVGLVRFVDNIIEMDYFDELLPQLAKRRDDVFIVFEVKANLKKGQIEILRDARVTVQAGIESLSSHVLRLMAKGTDALRNVQTLKWCKQFGVRADWNLLYGFPGEVPDDYRESLALAQVLTHLDPPSGCGPIRLDRFSPNFNEAARRGFANVRPMRLFRHLYALDQATLSDLVYYFDFDYERPIDDGGTIPALDRAIESWKGRSDSLVIEQLGDEVVIRDTRPVAVWPQTVMRGLTARVYEHCDRVRSVRQVVDAMCERGEVSESEIRSIIHELVEHKLMVQDGDKVLSLAVMTYTPAHEREDGRSAAAASRSEGEGGSQVRPGSLAVIQPTG
jgi:ribosomal peptide maturation radical SAM protein 1